MCITWKCPFVMFKWENIVANRLTREKKKLLEWGFYWARFRRAGGRGGRRVAQVPGARGEWGVGREKEAPVRNQCARLFSELANVDGERDARFQEGDVAGE